MTSVLQALFEHRFAMVKAGRDPAEFPVPLTLAEYHELRCMMPLTSNYHCHFSAEYITVAGVPIYIEEDNDETTD